MLLTTYDRLAAWREQPTDSLGWPSSRHGCRRIGSTPPRRRWEVVNLDTVRFTQADSLAQSADFRAKRYRKPPQSGECPQLDARGVQSFALVDEQTIDLNAGMTIISQNLLSNTEAYASYGWNHHEGSLFNLGVLLRAGRTSTSTPRTAATALLLLGQYNAQTGKYEYQSRLAPDKYYPWV